jgi:hypothetical protein
VFLPHLFASWFSHLLINSFLRLGLPMTFTRGIDWSPASARDRGCCRLRRRSSLCRVLATQVSSQLLFRCGLGHCHDSAVKRTLMASPIALRARVLNGFDIGIS